MIPKRFASGLKQSLKLKLYKCTLYTHIYFVRSQSYERNFCQYNMWRVESMQYRHRVYRDYIESNLRHDCRTKKGDKIVNGNLETWVAALFPSSIRSILDAFRAQPKTTNDFKMNAQRVDRGGPRDLFIDFPLHPQFTYRSHTSRSTSIISPTVFPQSLAVRSGAAGPTATCADDDVADIKIDWHWMNEWRRNRNEKMSQ